MRSRLDRAVRVRALARDNALCSWARHFTLSVSLHPSVSMGIGEFNSGGSPAIDLNPFQGERRNTPSRFILLVMLLKPDINADPILSSYAYLNFLNIICRELNLFLSSLD